MRRWLLTLLPWRWITRDGLGFFVMGLIVLCGAIWSFGALVEVGNVATTKQSLTTLPAPYAGYLFAGSVDLFIFYGYLKCHGPVWQIALSVFHILVGLATSLWFQWQHSKGIVDPVAVSVVPALAVAVSLDTWVVSQLVDWFHNRSSDIPTPLGEPEPDPETGEPEPELEPPDKNYPQPDPPGRGPKPRTRTKVARFTPEQETLIRQWVTEERSQRWMAGQLGLDDNGRTRRLAPLVRELKVKSNGSGS